MKKILQGLIIAFIFIVIPILSVEHVSASVVTTSFNVPLSSICSTTSNAPWNDLSEILGENDDISAWSLTGVTASTTALKQIGLNCNVGSAGSDFTIPVVPAGSVFDLVRFEVRGFTNHTGLNFNYYYSQYQHPLTIAVASTLGSSLSTQYIDIDSSDMSSTQWGYLTSCLNGSGDYDSDYCNFKITSSALASKSLDLDSIHLSTIYHYNDDVFNTRFEAFNITNLSTSTIPNRITTGSDLNVSYYYNSALDSSTSTAYTKIKVTLHNNFTNQDEYMYIPIGLKDIVTAGGITNFCEAMGCANGDTYNLDIQFVGDNELVRSVVYSTRYYFAYNSYVPTPITWSTTTFSTSSTAFNFSTSTASSSIVANLGTILSLSPTVEAVQTYCNFLNWSTFNIGGCLYYAIIPAEEDITVFLDVIRNVVLLKVPFIGNFWTTTAVNLPTINAVIPNGIIGSGASINLGISSTTFDFILDSKASDSGFGTSTKTFYETTSEYWNIFIYILLGLYFLSRMFSMGIFGGLQQERNTLSDTADSSSNPRRGLRKINGVWRKF
jgi:hypothetical protein